MIKIADCRDAAGDYFGVSPEIMRSPYGSRPNIAVKHLGMVLAREMTGASNEMIARAFGLQDHTTVIYARRRFRRAQNNPVVVLAMDEVKTLISKRVAARAA